MVAQLAFRVEAPECLAPGKFLERFRARRELHLGVHHSGGVAQDVQVAFEFLGD